jgi:tetratricopeptide (TPR) repeat protein
MTAIPLWRRIALAALTLVASTVLFHGQVASAVVTRGDDAMRNGDRAAALRYYGRALALDPASSRAADRFAFLLAIRHAPGDARTAVVIATLALAHSPDDPALLADRGFAEQRLRRWPAARDDFARAGAQARDARYDHLAGRVALHLGDRRGARQLFERALTLDPRFGPARVALEQLAWH